MELGSAGAILSYALGLEKQAIENYEQSLEEDLSTREREVLEANARTHRKNMKTLNRMRRENVTEMILEPIHDLKSDDFTVDVAASGQGLSTLPRLEQNLIEYLKTCSEKVSFLPGLSQALEDMAGRVAKNAHALANAGIG
jgi:hypothetical protein